MTYAQRLEAAFDAAQSDELTRLKGEAGVLRGLLREANGVIDSCINYDDSETAELCALRDKIDAAMKVAP